MNEPVKTSFFKHDKLTYKIVQYKELQKYYCVTCKKVKKSNQIVYYYEHGIEKRLCPRCYDRVTSCKVVNTTSKAIKKKSNKEEIKQYSANRITDPIKKIRFNNHHFMSTIELCIKNRHIYEDIIQYSRFYDVTISREIKRFLTDNQQYIQNVTNQDAVLFLSGKWIAIHTDNNWFSSVEELQGLKKIVSLTQTGELRWQEEHDIRSNSSINARYSVLFNNRKYIFSITGYRNADYKMQFILDLLYDNNGETKNCPSLFNKMLYSDIIKHAIKRKGTSYIKRKIQGEKLNEINIGSNDFVVRTNLFRCFYKEHMIEEIIGIINIIDSEGKKHEKKVPAAYCAKCNTFYILTSEYIRLSERGIILCQLIDKEDYYKNESIHEFNMAKESLLMRHGYNVKSSSGLTDLQRQAVLENILEENIMTAHRIVSYLDMFIAQKKALPQYKQAVEKWKKDRAFVLAHGEDKKSSFQIERIIK